MNKENKMIVFLLLLSMIFFAGPGYAEDIKGYSQCDICPGTIHYGPDEAKKIIGPEGQALIRKTNRSDRVVIKVDLDGVMRDGSASDNDTQYEIEISAIKHIVYIKSLLDGSYIQVVVDTPSSKRSAPSNDWLPEIYLQSSHSERIKLQDTVTAAWDKMKKSHIYDWVFCDQDHTAHPELLGNKILYSLRRIAEKRPQSSSMVPTLNRCRPIV